MFNLAFGKILKLFLKIMHVIGPIFIVVNSQILSKKSSYLVTLVSIYYFHSGPFIEANLSLFLTSRKSVQTSRPLYLNKTWIWSHFNFAFSTLLMSSSSPSVWPCWENYRCLGKKKYLGLFVGRFIYYLAKYFTNFGKILMLLGKFAFDKMAKYWTNYHTIWAHWSSSIKR